MKKLMLACCVISSCAITSVWADARSELQARLDKVKGFHANFSQLVTTMDGSRIQDATGELWVKRPNLFRWHTEKPDESLLISDGTTLWFYNPFVEQVTASDLNSSTNNTPFILIARNKASDWDKYNVTQNSDSFHLTPKQAQESNLKQFDITVSPDGYIKTFAAVEQDGQRSTYTLSGQQNSVADSQRFHFTPPKGVTVDDQRKKR